MNLQILLRALDDLLDENDEVQMLDKLSIMLGAYIDDEDVTRKIRQLKSQFN